MNDLINKVDGIEKAREIVGGAPEGATIISLATLQYFRKLVNPLYENEPNVFMRVRITEDGFLEHSTRFAPIILPIELDDLRTAIAEHDSGEFKVGDLVVIKANPFWPEDYFIQQVESENIGKWYMNAWRHATPEEIKAGHRLEAERHG